MPDGEGPEAWALVQTKPQVAVLAVSRERDRIKREGQILAEIQNEIADPVHHQWWILPLEMVRV